MLEKKPIEAADVEAHVVRDSSAAFLCTILVGIWAYWLLPSYFTLLTESVEGLIAAVQLAIVPLLVLLVAVFLVSTTRRRSATDGLGAAYSSPSRELAFKQAYLQNTLEQTVLLVGALLIGGTVLLGPTFSILYAAVFLFLLGRITFYFGYRKHPLRRAFGMALTMFPAILLYGFFVFVLLSPYVGITF